MNIINYERVTIYEIGDLLEKELQLNDYQKSIIGGVLSTLPYTFVDLREPIPVVPIMRFTIPFYFLTWLLLLLAIPFKWFLTGKPKYKYGDKIVVFLFNWKSKLNL